MTRSHRSHAVVVAYLLESVRLAIFEAVHMAREKCEGCHLESDTKATGPMNILRKWFNTHGRKRSASSAKHLRRALEKAGANPVITDGWIVGVYNQDTLNANREKLNELKACLRNVKGME